MEVQVKAPPAEKGANSPLDPTPETPKAPSAPAADADADAEHAVGTKRPAPMITFERSLSMRSTVEATVDLSDNE
eukprot:278518-Prorocentrum_minimum.AAC.1